MTAVGRQRQVKVIGIGRTAFGRHPGLTGRQLGVEAARAALADAHISWEDVDAAYGGSNAGGNADAVIADLGLTGIPFTNVRNGCATGGSALIAGCNAIRAGVADVVLVVGFDKHPRGAFSPTPADYGIPSWFGEQGMMVTTQFFAMKIMRYMHDFGITSGTLSAVAAKSYRFGALTPEAWRRTPLTRDEIESSQMVNDPLTQYMFCSPAAGGAAVVLAGDAVSAGRDRAVTLRATSFTSRPFGSFEVFSPCLPPGALTSVSIGAARTAFEAAGLTPGEVEVAQLQDTESGAEIMHMAECGFCEDGAQEELVAGGETDLTGKLPVNTDGGCIANGEPIGASGLRQVHEVVTQLRGEAGERQVAREPVVGFTHVYGAPGVSACAVITRD